MWEDLTISEFERSNIMSKIKWSNILSATAILGAAVAGGMILYKKYKSYQETFNDDFDDFEDDFDDEDLDFKDEDSSVSPKREYVPINLETEKKVAETNINDESVTKEPELKESTVDELKVDEL